MTSILLKRLQRDPKFRKQEAPPPAALDTSALNTAIGELIRQAAQAGAEEAVKKHPVQQPASPKVPPHLRDFTSEPLSSDFPPPPPRTAPPKDLTVSIQRDAAGMARYASVGKVLFEIQRDSTGKAVRMVQVDEAPVLPPPPIPYKAAARKYKKGEPQ